MQRIAILGAGGAGKTVLAGSLGQLLGLPVIHLDALRYTIDWALVPEEDFAAAQHAAVAGAAWVIDGNNLQTLHIRAAAADAIIVVDPHPLVCLLGVVRRQLRFGSGQHPDGVYVRVTAPFLRYVWRYRRDHLPRVMVCIRDHAPDAKVIPLTSRRQANRFTAALTDADDQRNDD
jgi:adenylate kinase family enzyme